MPSKTTLNFLRFATTLYDPRYTFFAFKVVDFFVSVSHQAHVLAERSVYRNSSEAKREHKARDGYINVAASFPIIVELGAQLALILPLLFRNL